MISKSKTIQILIVLLFIAIFYSYSPRKIEYLGYYNKVYAHRVNSIEKLNAALHFFKGVELDLVYKKDKNILDVNHPPAQSINLNFETYINEIEQGTFPFLWLDIKNLNINTAQDIFVKLNSILDKLSYPKNKILIETFYPEALSIFTKAGYHTSYYLPPKLYKNVDLENEIKKINIILKKQPNIGISTNFEDYEIIKTNFPNQKKYIWALVPNINTKFWKIRKLLKDEKVEIVLSKYKAFYGNR